MKRVVSAVVALSLSSSYHGGGGGGGGVSAAAAANFALSTTSWNDDNPFAPPDPYRWTTPQSPYASYLGTLLSAARPTANSSRLNEEQQQLRRSLENDDDGASSSSIDLSSYSIKFEKCQYIKQYATDSDDRSSSSSETVLETKKFVIFRLCPSSSSSSSSGSSSSTTTTTTTSCTSSNCKSNYGEYVIDLETYLEATLQIKSDEQEAYCEACQYCDAGNDDAAAEGVDAVDEEDADDRRRRRQRQLTSSSSVDCSTCYDQCQNIANMGDYGYADASEYYKCEKVYENENKNLVYYAGAMCSNSGTRIKVGLFTDANCENYDTNASPDAYIKKNGYNVKLSYHLMKKTFVNDECITSCASYNHYSNNAHDENDDGDNDNAVAEICQNLYSSSGKCETPHGFTSGITSSSSSSSYSSSSSSSEYYDEYSTQIDNEDTVCQYIANINSGAYDDSGELIVKTSTLYIVGGGRSSITSVQTTGGQKFALTFFVIGTVGLVAYAAYLRQKVNQCVKKGLLERIGGGGRSHLVVGSGGYMA
jgi:hypothetical protein